MTLFSLLCLVGSVSANASTESRSPSAPERTVPAIRWDTRAAEHLLNRAGFGGTRAEVDRIVALGLEAAVESLFPVSSTAPAPEILSERSLHGGLETPSERYASMEARREGYSRLQPDLIIPLNKFGDWWVERMIAADDPVRDRMTIFWHGHLVSSIKEVANSQDMITQMRFLRDNALGSFEVLARGISRDPAMLRYLNNDTNVKDHPNENYARELMELFCLGDGNYTETDIKESARALTGWSQTASRFDYRRTEHDFGQKSFLGVTGNLDGDHVVSVILEQPACARYLAHKLLEHFEGVTSSAARVEVYAEGLRRDEYQIGRMLKRLFKDPEFYRDEVLAARVTPPVEYLVGAARRLGLHPPGQMVLNAGDVLGQRLFWPPSVKGWEGGMAWVPTGLLMHRSNMIGVMLGVVDVRELMHDDEFAARDAAMTAGQDSNAPAAGRDSATMTAQKKREKPSRTAGFNHLHYIQDTGWKPDLALAERARLTGKLSDADLVAWMLDEFLAIRVSADLEAEALAFLRSEREAAGLDAGSAAASAAASVAGRWLEDASKAEPVLRRLAHMILSQPEAQMN